MNVRLNLKRSAGLALGGLLISASLCGCQTTIGGQTLPSAHYLEDDIQYFPAGEEVSAAEHAACSSGVQGGSCWRECRDVQPDPVVVGWRTECAPVFSLQISKRPHGSVRGVFHLGPGHPGGECRGQRPCPPRPSRREMSEGEHVQARTTCRMPLTNPRGLQSERFGLRSSQRRFHKGDIRCVPRFLVEGPPAAGVRPLDPSGRGTLGLSEQCCAGKDGVRAFRGDAAPFNASSRATQ